MNRASSSRAARGDRPARSPDPLDTFHPAVAGWFRASFPGGPTDAQRAAWPPIRSGRNTLVAAPTGSGHGGTDDLELREFIRAVRAGTQTPLDVYDSVVMSVILPLSERSIAAGSAPVECPDFTSGKWRTTPPKFAVDRS